MQMICVIFFFDCIVSYNEKCKIKDYIGSIFFQTNYVPQKKAFETYLGMNVEKNGICYYLGAPSDVLIPIDPRPQGYYLLIDPFDGQWRTFTLLPAEW
jgi:hypothetical protein